MAASLSAAISITSGRSIRLVRHCILIARQALITPGLAPLTAATECGVMVSHSNPCMAQVPNHAPSYVSVENQFPEDLFDAMRGFVSSHPQWDQYRLMQAALAGFLFQHGCQDRAVARHYLDGLFQHQQSNALCRPQ
jgi:hypothetical protein